jgi:hypothetical protein
VPQTEVAALLESAGIAARRIREAIDRLTSGPLPLDDLIRECALPRRTVEALLRAAGSDLMESAEGVALPATYRQSFERPDAALAERMASLIAAAPAADRSLDHVSATAGTAARRALWLAATYDLAGAHLLCVGDHDLTSLAVAAHTPACRVSVVDLDERLLDFIAGSAASVDCYYADLRLGLPPSLVDSADLVFTDPPYTPDGVKLFLGRGAQSLRDRVNGRLVMAYGFSPLTPALGVKVQRSVHELDLAIEAILPAFNRYHGAQAIGSASDLYVCRPTPRTFQIVDRQLAKAAANLYTHGTQSVEARAATLPDFATPTGELDLSADPGPWLLRALLGINADRLEILVPNRHPDIADEISQKSLRALLAAKYTLRFRRSTPDPHHAIVEATATPDDGALPHWLLTHAHGKLANVLRDGLVHTHAATTKNEARALIPPSRWLAARFIDVPRYAIHDMLFS